MTWKRFSLVMILLILWFATAIPLGLLAYSMKNSWGYDTFSRSGFHAVNACLVQEFQKYKRPPEVDHE